jgi:hypothetical protein
VRDGTEGSPPRIVEAMIELADRRDNGELVHDILAEVATEFQVRLELLKDRAEKSWGTPLELDYERNRAHFAVLEHKRKINREGQEYAALLWGKSAEILKNNSWLRIDWFELKRSILANIRFENSVYETEFSLGFSGEIERLRSVAWNSRLNAKRPSEIDHA